MKYVFISEYANKAVKEFVHSLDKKIVEIKRTNHVYSEISDHPDIYMCLLNNSLIIAKEQIPLIASDLGFYNNQNNKGKLVSYEISDYVNYINEKLSPIKVYSGAKSIGHKYPGSCIFNCVQIGNYFLHNVAYTDPIILDLVKQHEYKIINVMQGYTNCNIVFIDENSIITSDSGIAKTLNAASPELDVLLVSEGNVTLKGFPHGFLGGCCGRIDDYIIFNGNLEAHPDFTSIKKFIENKDLCLKYFTEYPLTDIGSIIGI